MSVAADRSEIGQQPPPTTGDPRASGGAPVGETCPLCGAPLQPEQEWCLRCGAAARTRLAASSHWKAPIVALAIVTTLSLGVLAAAVVKLVGDSRSPATPATTTVTTAPAAVTPTTTAATPAPTAPTVAPPGGSTPGAVALAPVTALASSVATLNGMVNPQGVPTTYQFHFGTSASYGSPSAAPATLGAGTSAIAVSAKIAGLAPGTTYHYQLTASKAGRAISTADATFTTPAAHSRPGARSTPSARTPGAVTPGATTTKPPQTAAERRRRLNERNRLRKPGPQGK